MSGARRIRGTSWPVTEAWRLGVKADLRAAGISYADLADRIGANPGSIYLILNRGVPSSRFVPRIHEVLGRPPPIVMPSVDVDSMLRGICERWPLLSQADREAVASFVDQRAPR